MRSEIVRTRKIKMLALLLQNSNHEYNYQKPQVLSKISPKNSKLQSKFLQKSWKNAKID